MGIHSNRLAASRTHRHCVAATKLAVRKIGREIPAPRDISPNIVGAQPLSFPVPPMLEEALGYRGALRFVSFGYSARTRQFTYCDGGDNIPADPEPWLSFLRHPLIAPHLPKKRYIPLYGVFTNKDRPPALHWLLLDREKRRACICRWDQLILLFALVEPEDEDYHTVFVDGLLMSPGNEDYKIPPQSEALERLREFLDEFTSPPAQND